MLTPFADLMMSDPDDDPDDDGEGREGRSDLHHDAWLAPAPSSPLAAIADEVFSETESSTPSTLRKPRQDARQRRQAIIANLIANLATLAVYRPSGGTRLAVSAKNSAKSRYTRPAFRPNLIADAASALETIGIVTRTIGKRNETRTTIAPSAMLRRRLARIDPADIIRLAGAETIILRARTEGRSKGRTGARDKVLIDYADTAETHRLRGEMATINAFLAVTPITHAGDPLPPFLLTRRFIITSPSASHTFDRHGRIYGGPWIAMERDERPFLRIAGERLVDLDFTGMFAQLAYLAAALPPPDGDPYSGVAGLTDDDPSRDAVSSRAAVKRAFSALLSRSGPMRQLPKAIKALLGKDWTAARLTAALTARHPDIAHLFGKDIGVSLLFTESRIMVRTLLDLIDQGIPALPVHDGMMVQASMQAAGEAAMRRASEYIVGVALPTKAKPLK